MFSKYDSDISAFPVSTQRSLDQKALALDLDHLVLNPKIWPKDVSLLCFS